MRSFEEDLEAAVSYHGHRCPGMVIGVRLARLGLQYLGIEDPQKYRDLVVYVEMDRCAADAIGVTTNCKLGRRRLKWVDYGKMAATFIDLATNKAVRIAAATGAPQPTKGADPVAFFAGTPDEELFTTEPVEVDVPVDDRPGSPSHTVICQRCGEQVRNRREVVREGQILCRACAGQPYYQRLSTQKLSAFQGEE